MIDNHYLGKNWGQLQCITQGVFKRICGTINKIMLTKDPLWNQS